MHSLVKTYWIKFNTRTSGRDYISKRFCKKKCCIEEQIMLPYKLLASLSLDGRSWTQSHGTHSLVWKNVSRTRSVVVDLSADVIWESVRFQVPVITHKFWALLTTDSKFKNHNMKVGLKFGYLFVLQLINNISWDICHHITTFDRKTKIWYLDTTPQNRFDWCEIWYRFNACISLRVEFLHVPLLFGYSLLEL